ncbi:DUF3291 domain-containing protein [Mesorhizobium sp.]|uniref:DUF3291 domain-containing protein n=1 Tax=Mesorhizobium sp. TaxID=1871066 RepID=UPI000FE52450|nr:DUF3291 domain-containing protein [Mesorhizobium sp.]RWM39930.1 MAG: DUF3291 domain-containing protein [Mesorhizobium sp.]
MKKNRIALYTFGTFRAPASDPVNQGFHDRNDRNFQVAELSEGFVARSGYQDEPGPESWGVQVFPRFYVERGDGWSPSTLSLWEDLASPMAFSYAGVHAESMRHGREWFDKPAWPPYALWWVDLDHVPTWSVAVVRHEFLHDNGPGPFAFDFKMPFDEHGRPTVIDRELVRQKMRLNEVGQQQRLT